MEPVQAGRQAETQKSVRRQDPLPEGFIKPEDFAYLARLASRTLPYIEPPPIATLRRIDGEGRETEQALDRTKPSGMCRI